MKIQLSELSQAVVLTEDVSELLKTNEKCQVFSINWSWHMKSLSYYPFCIIYHLKQLAGDVSAK